MTNGPDEPNAPKELIATSCGMEVWGTLVDSPFGPWWELTLTQGEREIRSIVSMLTVEMAHVDVLEMDANRMLRDMLQADFKRVRPEESS